MITKLDPKYLTCDFNFEAIGTVIVPCGEDNVVIVAGNFRSHHDYIGVSWLSADKWSHNHNKYPISTNFSNVELSYNYQIEGKNAPMDSEQGAPVITVVTTNGKEYYVRLWNYTVNRPRDDWEEGSGTLFPSGRTPGSASGTSGHIVIDFNNLYAGWRAYDDTYPIVGYDEEGNPITEQVWVPSNDWEKIDQSKIKELRWGFNMAEYDKDDPSPLDDSYPFKVTMNNWTVTGDIDLGEDIQPLPPHLYRLCDGYDDSYNVTPKRLVEEFYNLGFRKIINIYVGCSHFYDKISDGTPTPGEYEPYRYVIKTDRMFNAAFELWWKDFLLWAKHYGFEEVVASISMESVNAPPEWWQRTADGQPGITLWTPTPHLVSFCNEDLRAYYKRYVKALADSQQNAGLPISVQLGEPWWWWREDLDDDPPCFYDEATKLAHRNALGYNIPEWHSAWEDFKGCEETLQWLRAQNGEFAGMLRDHLRSCYHGAKFTVLFFPPSVLDVGRVPKMMQIVNFPQEYWKNVANNLYLDFFQIEDYDYLLFNQVTEHAQIYDFVWNYLQYQFHRTHYFAGFYPTQEILDAWPNVVTDGLWDRINEAAIDGINEEFESFIWAGPEIRIYNWLPPPMKWKAKSATLRSITFYGG
ncbi:non-contractile tail sheath protein [Tepidanaerobacter syntrophicus]|uniref:non-contractile tail sheath protein n=1 Tax=Tepidanaerobacter syntrophicus TaxID=224999 RepID=UPI001BD69597|nr:hypothetical protein [Tepidanaerobacter syntrophicus]